MVKLAHNLATIDGKSPAELKHLVLKEHRRVQRAEQDQHVVRMTERWARRVLDAARAARPATAPPEQVLWDRKGKWRAERLARADVFAPAGGPARTKGSCWRLPEGEAHRCTAGETCDCPPLSARAGSRDTGPQPRSSYTRLSDFWRGQGEGESGSPLRRRGTGLAAGKSSRLSSPLSRRGTGLLAESPPYADKASVLTSPLHPAAERDGTAIGDSAEWRNLISGKPLDLGTANDARLGELRGLLELMARKKIGALELLAEAESTKALLDGTKTQVAQLLHTHDSLTGGSAGAANTLRGHKRKLRKCQQERRDVLNVMSCCRSISQVKEIPDGWRWSDQRAMCDACRTTLHKLQIVHSRAELLASTVAHEELRLAQTKQAMASVGAAVAQVLNEAIYRPVTFRSRPGTDEGAHGEAFVCLCDDFPSVLSARDRRVYRDKRRVSIDR
jgi:hypothetical protein